VTSLANALGFVALALLLVQIPRAAVGAVIALAVLAAMSARLRPGRQTRPWRIVHVLLSTAAVSLALGHVAGVGRYLGLDALGGIALSLLPLAALAGLYLQPEHPDGP
jgi:hypothetical protein